MNKLIALVMALPIAGVALAHEGATGVIAERMTAMKNMGQELKAIADILSGRVAFDAEKVRHHAEAFHENCHKIDSLFPPGSIDRHSEALPAIWERPEEFAEEIRRLHSAAESFVDNAAIGDKAQIAGALNEIQQACNSCHETFRQSEH